MKLIIGMCISTLICYFSPVCYFAGVMLLMSILLLISLDSSREDRAVEAMVRFSIITIISVTLVVIIKDIIIPIVNNF
jgi:hypothetical protein